MDLTVFDKVFDALCTARKALFIFLAVIICGLFARSCLNEVKYDIINLADALERIQKQIENTTLLNGDGSQQEEFKDWSSQQMSLIEREILKLRDGIKSHKTSMGMTSRKRERFDLAHQNSGARIASIHDTQLLEGERCGTVKTLFGYCHPPNPPEKAIQSSNEPNECFCFKGTQGAFTVRLACEAVLDEATLEHIPRSLSPTNDISSAPKEFTLIGLREINDENGVEYGNFNFDPFSNIKQVYTLPQKVEKVQYVTMNILSNHGDETQTCIYRLKLHGLVENC